MQVIGVGQLDLTMHITQIHSRYAALDRGRGADVHEHRRLYCAVYRLKAAAACATFLLYKCKHIILTMAFAMLIL